MHFPPAALVPAATTGLIPGVLLVVPPSVACCNSGRPRALLYGTLPSLGPLRLGRGLFGRMMGPSTGNTQSLGEEHLVQEQHHVQR